MLPWLKCLLQGVLTNCLNWVKSLFWREVLPLANPSLHYFLSSSLRLLWKLQYLGNHCLRSLITKGRGTSASLEQLCCCQDGCYSVTCVHPCAWHPFLCARLFKMPEIQIIRIALTSRKVLSHIKPNHNTRKEETMQIYQHYLRCDRSQ